MSRKLLGLGAALIVALVGVVLAREVTWTDAYWLWRSRGSFDETQIPFAATQLLMDIGVVDANDDGLLDIFTTNHNYRQDLLIADGKGGYRDTLSAWGLDQSIEFPGLEIALSEPDTSAPGVYIYWQGRRTLRIRAVRAGQFGRLQGKLRTHTAIEPVKSDGFNVEPTKLPPGAADRAFETTTGFSSAGDGTLDLDVDTPGVPIVVDLDPPFPLASVHIGKSLASPTSRSFELTFQDRHGMAWADYNDDGRLDMFISRGALSGTLLALPESIGDALQDELLVSQGPGQYRNMARDVGIEKRGCSGRKVNWVDFDRDGRLDLFVNCQDRGNVRALYPKQLYRQGEDKKFTAVAAQVGLDLPEHEIIDFVWFDADNDGYVDLLTSEATGFYLYRNHEGERFTREFVGRGKFARADNPKLKGNAEEYWFVDGKLAVADFRGSGNLDVFSSSKTGNHLLLNDGSGHFKLVDPTTVGLPAESATAAWVDFDNDGLIDLYAVPQGLLRQRPDRTFESTGLLALPPRKYMAAIANWADLGNDGRRDLVLAVNENFALWRWWEKIRKSSEDRFAWKLVVYRNEVAKTNHWLELKLVGKPGNAQAIGARVVVQTADGRQTQQVGLNDGAFFSQGHYRLYFGLGSRSRVDRVTIRWPDGGVQELKGVGGDRLLVVHEGQAEASEAAK
jgi:hypothetical protein